MFRLKDNHIFLLLKVHFQLISRFSDNYALIPTNIKYKTIVIFVVRNITKLLLTNDLTEDVAIEAEKHGCEMIVAYHPPIFAPLKSITQR